MKWLAGLTFYLLFWTMHKLKIVPFRHMVYPYDPLWPAIHCHNRPSMLLILPLGEDVFPHENNTGWKIQIDHEFSGWLGLPFCFRSFCFQDNTRWAVRTKFQRECLFPAVLRISAGQIRREMPLSWNEAYPSLLAFSGYSYGGFSF